MRCRLIVAACVSAAVLLGLPTASALAKVSWQGSYVRVTSGVQYTNKSVPIDFYGSCTGLGAILLLTMVSGDADIAQMPRAQYLLADNQSAGGDTSWCSGHAVIPLMSGDGVKQVGVHWAAAITDVTELSPVYTVQVTLDTVGPKTVAPYKLSCKRGGYVTVSYQVDDSISPTATVSLQARNAKGKTLRTVDLGVQDTGKLVTYLWQPGFAKGGYKYAILATDLVVLC